MYINVATWTFWELLWQPEYRGRTLPCNPCKTLIMVMLKPGKLVEPFRNLQRGGHLRVETWTPMVVHVGLGGLFGALIGSRKKGACGHIRVT